MEHRRVLIQANRVQSRSSPVEMSPVSSRQEHIACTTNVGTAAAQGANRIGSEWIALPFRSLYDPLQQTGGTFTGP
jgi:hypothetical protein